LGSVCLFVCLLAGLCENYRTDFRESWWTCGVRDKEEVLTFGAGLIMRLDPGFFSPETVQDSIQLHLHCVTYNIGKLCAVYQRRESRMGLVEVCTL